MIRLLALVLLLLSAGTHAQTRSWTYDAAGNVLTSTDANGHTTSYAYDGLNRRTSQTDALGVAQQWTYDAAGNVLTHTDGRGIVMATTYDGENRPVEVKRDGLRIATSTYDAAGNLSRSTDANGEATTYAYDAANRKLSEQRPLGHARQWTHTPWDAIATATDADGYVTAYAYDVRQRLIEQTDPAGETTTHGYDGVGNRTRTSRPGGLEWTYAFDEADRLIRITSPEGATTAYRHDAHGNRTRFTDAQGQITTTAYDSRHRPIRINHPGGTHEEFTYDQEANPTGHTDASGRTIASTYDALNRRTRRDYGSVPSGDVQEERWDYDGNGNLTRIQQHTGSATHTTGRVWDRHERLVQETDRHSQTTQWGYDAHGNRITRTDAEGTTSTPPDRLNRTTRLTAPDGSATLFAYTPEGRLTTLTQPNGAQTEHAYDDAGRIQSIVHRQNGTQVSITTYAYDPRGNRIEETQTDPTGTRTTTYGYDDDDRLIATEETAPDGSTTQTTYTLDATGNRTREHVTQNGVTTKDVSYTYGPRQQLDQSVDAISGETITYTYDASGALKEETRNGQTTHYRQNAQDRLATLTLPGTPPIQYAYDAEGRRVEKLTHTEGRRYVWDGQHIRRETNVTDNPLISYEWSSGRILRSKQGSAIAYAQHDALKSPTRWSKQDGGEQGRTRYGAWGTTESEQGTTPPIGYTGHYQDPETGDYYAQQRYYRPGIGRFTRTDPWSGDELSPITLNKYLYANGNPLIYVDPDGRVGYLSDLRDFFDSNDDYYAQTIKSEQTGWWSAVGHGALRGLNALASTPVRALNTASNITASALPGEFFAGVRDEGVTDLETGAFPATQASVELAQYAYNNPLEATGKAVIHSHQYGTRLAQRDKEAWASLGSFGAGLAVPGGAMARALRSPDVPVPNGRRVPDRSPDRSLADETVDRANQQSKPVTVAEGPDGTPELWVERQVVVNAAIDPVGDASRTALTTMERRLQRLGYDDVNTDRLLRSIENGEQVVIVGENMRRVNAVSRMVEEAGGAPVTYAPRNWGGMNRNSLEANRSWIRYWALDKSAPVIDIGRQPTPRPLGPSPFYGIENRSLNKWGVYTPFDD